MSGASLWLDADDANGPPLTATAPAGGGVREPRAAAARQRRLRDRLERSGVSAVHDICAPFCVQRDYCFRTTTAPLVRTEYDRIGILSCASALVRLRRNGFF